MLAAATVVGLVGALACSQPVVAAEQPRATGDVMSNFQVLLDGFQFANYGTGPYTATNPPPPELTWSGADTYRLWGPLMCTNTAATADNCVTGPLAQSELDTAGYTSGNNGGMCFGLAMLSQLLFGHNITPQQIDPTYGANEPTYEFPQASGPVSPKLLHEIYFWYTSQILLTNDNGPYTSPNTAYQMLAAAFGPGGNPNHIPYVLDLSDHAITPIGVSPTGPNPGWSTIFVYDNNWPGVVQKLYVINRPGWENIFYYVPNFTGTWPQVPDPSSGSAAAGPDELLGALSNAYMYGGPNTGPGQLGWLALSSMNMLPSPACQAVGLCPGPDTSTQNTTVAASIQPGSADKGIAMKILSSKRRAIDRTRLHYTSSAHTQVLANVPMRANEFTAVITDRGSSHSQTVQLGAFGGGHSLAARQIVIPPRGKVRLMFNRDTGAVKIVGARNVDFEGVASRGKFDYRVNFDVFDHARSGGSGQASIGRSSGIAQYVSTASTAQRVKATVTRHSVAKDGETVRTTKHRWFTVAPGGIIAVNYGTWTRGTLPTFS